MAALVVFTALLFWVCVFLVVFTAQGTTPFDYFFGRYEELPPDLGVWKDFGIDSKTGLSREERWLLPGGQDSARLVRQVRYRNAVTHAIIEVEPEVRVRRRRVSAR